MILVWYIIASLIASIVFGLQILILMLFKKTNINTKLSKYVFQLLFLVAFFILYFNAPVKVPVLNIVGIFTFKNIIIFLVTIFLTSYIVSFEKCEKHNFFEWSLLGISMEIPQRLFMQTFFMIVLRNMKLNNADLISILLNTILWIQFIFAQDIICGQKINRSVIPKILSSVCFSLGMGMLYVWSGCIIVTMIGHGTERILSDKLREKNDSIINYFHS
ncbi:hypothetical protein [Clostridium sp. UBA6640]|uniref:hypothetical protein n=1 Tax=Clostridium sp. UBA6640 TaxID=1946370 RepID=UPI0025C2F7F5|nr:hypothetical protein [Clostridium sp. UBA6640]